MYYTDLTYTVIVDTPNVAKAQQTISDEGYVEGDFKVNDFGNGRSSLTFECHTEFEDGVRNDIFHEDDFDLYDRAFDTCDEIAKFLADAGIYSAVDYNAKEVESIANDLEEEYPSEPDEFCQMDEWIEDHKH